MVYLHDCAWRGAALAQLPNKAKYRNFNAQCLAKGFTPNTDAFRLCMDNRGIERRVKAAEWEAWEANQKAEQSAQGATTSCILSGGVMIGSTCVN